MPEHEVDAGLVIRQRSEQDKREMGIDSGKKRIGLVIPVLNSFENAIDCLQSIRTKHIISVYVQPQYRHLVALSAAWNTGIKKAFADGCDYALVCNDDIIFSPETIDNLVSEYERLHQEGCILLSPSNIFGQLPSKWAIMDYYLKEAEPITTADHPDFSCFFIANGFFDEVGTFDENFYPAWCEDQDMHQRIHLAGKRALVSTACPFVHLGSVTTSRLPSVDSSTSNIHFMRKWGSHNNHVPQAYTHPYNDPNKTYKEW